jgi:hypothetical protein
MEEEEEGGGGGGEEDNDEEDVVVMWLGMKVMSKMSDGELCSLISIPSCKRRGAPFA